VNLEVTALSVNKMWSLYENEKELKPLVFSNGKSQADVVEEVVKSAKEGNKVIFIRGMCGTGKSAIALNLARRFGRTSIVVPIKSLQKQYQEDYTNRKYLLRDGKKIKISLIVGRNNFKCRFLKERGSIINEKNAKLSDIFEEKPKLSRTDSCDNDNLPCKIEIKEKNLKTLKEYIRQNPNVKLTDFTKINEIKRMSIAPICPYWSPIVPEDLDIRIFNSLKKIKYKGLNNRNFVIYQRENGCPYYEQYLDYLSSDVLIFNSLKYKIETLMDRKPETELEIIDECDEFLDSLVEKEQINLDRLLISLNNLLFEKRELEDIILKMIEIIKEIKETYPSSSETFILKDTTLNSLLKMALSEDLEHELDLEEINYASHLNRVAKIFEGLTDETYFSVEKKEKDLIVSLVTTNIKKRLREILDKNKTIVMMSGTIHSESVLRNIFGLENFKIIDAETERLGDLKICKQGYELDCRYSNLKKTPGFRKIYLLALSKSVSCAKRPTLVHVTSFYDLPTSSEKKILNIDNLPTQEELIIQQKEDPLGKRISDFKNKKTDILFTTKCGRGADFPGDTCNSIIITRFPYPDISSLFWKVLKKNHPEYFRGFYLDKSKRELLQRVYRGLRSRDDKVYLLSPDIRVLNFNFH
jgi:Rad3-related DNA helicase